MIKRFLPVVLLYLALLEIYSVLPSRIQPVRDPEHTVVSGAIHLPISRGKLNAKLDALTLAAGRAGMDFLVLANLDQTFPDRASGPRNGVDVYAELETSTPAGHALLFHSHTTAADLSDKKLRDLTWKHFLGTDSHKGVFVVTAHPSSYFFPWERLDRYAEGIELINLRSMVERQALESPFSFALTAIISPFNQYLAALRLFEPQTREFKGWDAVNEVSSGHFGIAATDNLSDWPLITRLGVAIPPPEQSLPFVSNAVFLDGPPAKEFAAKRSQIYRALRDGKSAIVLQALHPFAGNDWSLDCDGKQYRSGDKFALLEKGCEFRIQLPKTLSGSRRIVLLREGTVVAEIPRAKDVERISVDQDGAYRLEVWVRRASRFRILLNREVPYLFYNPLYVR